MIVCLITGLILFLGSPVLGAVVKEIGFSCSLGKHLCNNGACLDFERVCDGHVDCADASDEKGCQANEIPFLITVEVRSLNRSSSQSTCRKNEWQCKDGTCITLKGICNRLWDCPDKSDEAPALCQKMRSESSIIFVATGGTQPTVVTLPVTHSQLVTEMPAEPVPMRSAESSGTNEHQYPHNDLPIRKGYCKLNPHPSVKYWCLDSNSTDGTSNLRDCKVYEPQDTVVSPQCAPYYIGKHPMPDMRCRGGSWSYVVTCKIVCGEVSPKGTALVEGKSAGSGQGFPWHAVIYRKNTQPYQRICAGSLVREHFIISAARCFWSETGEKELIPASEFEVIVGKLYESLNDKEERTQTSSVSRLFLPPRFGRENVNYQDDIALVIVKTPFTYTASVRPVCVDFNIEFDNEQLQEGHIGKVPGWWRNDSSLVQIRNLPYVAIERCIVRGFGYITSDKICAGKQPASALCIEDTGAGLVFGENYNSGERYYLRGVVSSYFDSERCISQEFATFTQIIKHKSFIQIYWELLDTGKFDNNNNDRVEKPKPRDYDMCSAPPFPEHGAYVTTANVMRNVSGENDNYELVTLTVTCDQGYGIQGPSTIKCFNGFWPEKVPQCIRMCALAEHPSVEYRCLLTGAQEGSRACSEYEPPGVVVRPRCRQPHYYSTGPLPFMQCKNNAQWSYIARCKPDCGRATPKGQWLAIGGSNVKHGELPWHAGIYDKRTRPYMQVCGGSLISNNLILSAAHCFWSGSHPLSETQFAAAVGKMYRPWNDKKDFAQKSDVKHIHIPPRFQGSDANFQDDIAVIVVVRAFKYRSYVRPVCLSFNANFEKQQLQTINKGKVAGWGLTSVNGKASPVLRVVELPYVEVKTCIAKSPTAFVQFITSDKICAGTRQTNTALCRGDSGGGLVFPATERNIERYYLRGVVSTAPTDEANNACNAAVYTAFTRILQHEDFIVPYLNDF